MRRVCVVVTARPSYSRSLTMLRALDARHDVDLTVLCCASAVMERYGNVAQLAESEGFRVERLSSVVEDDTLANSALGTGVLLMGLSGALERLRPDVVVTIADRHETLATAIAASYQHIPLAHVQGGEVTGSIDDKVRNAVTQLADVHLVATEGALHRVAEMRTRNRDIHVVGCPGVDLALDAKLAGPIHRADVVVLQHPVTNEADQAGAQMRATIEAVGTDALYFWPGEDAGGAAMSKVLRLAGIKPVRNLEPVEFLRVLLGARVLVGNSSVGIRECSFLGVPVVDIGNRQAGRECAGNVMRSSNHRRDIRINMEAFFAAGLHVRSSTLYGDGHAGERIAAILAGKAVEAVA